MFNNEAIIFIFFGMSIFVYTAFFVMYIMTLVSMDRLIQALREEDDKSKYINKAWIWTQLIPIWNFIAFIVCHIKINNIVRNVEKNNRLQKYQCDYPVVIGWLFIISCLISIIPAIIFLVIFWIKLDRTKNFIANLQTKNIS